MHILPCCMCILTLICLSLVVEPSGVWDTWGNLAREGWGQRRHSVPHVFLCISSFLPHHPCPAVSSLCLWPPFCCCCTCETFAALHIPQLQWKFQFQLHLGVDLPDSISACLSSGPMVACPCFPLHVFSWQLSSRLSCEVWVAQGGWSLSSNISVNLADLWGVTAAHVLQHACCRGWTQQQLNYVRNKHIYLVQSLVTPPCGTGLCILHCLKAEWETGKGNPCWVMQMPTQLFTALGQEGEKTTCITHSAPARGFSISPNHSFSFFCQKCWRLFSPKSPKKKKKKVYGDVSQFGKGQI